MCGHVCALEHLRKSSERPYDAFDDLKRRLRALVERVRQAIRVVGISWHASHSSTVHPAHAPHSSNTAHAAIHATVTSSVHASHTAHAGVWRRVRRVPAITTISATAQSRCAVIGVIGCRLVDY